MAVYGKKYLITGATKNNTIATIELWQDGYADTPIEYPAVNMNLQYIPKSDFVYEPIIASQLDVTIDVTDNIVQMPDFTTMNDKKYWVKMFIAGNQEWSGWALSDNVQFSFTTGRRHLSFNCVDGIGMLESLPFPFTENSSPAFTPFILKWFISQCVQQIGLAGQLNLHFICSYYASGMDDRSVGTQYEPFNQASLIINNFRKEDGTFENCLFVISQIAKTFGCRFFQARNKWYMVAINEFANESVYFTEYQYNGIYVSSGLEDTHSLVEPFTGNTSGVYFVDNSQFKIFRKGYANFLHNHTINYAANYVANSDLKILDAYSMPKWWITGVIGTGTSITLDTTTYNSKNIFVLNAGYGSGTRMARITGTVPTVLQNDKLVFSCTIYQAELSKIRGKLYLEITGEGGYPIYYYSAGGFWRNTTAPSPNYYEFEPVTNTTANDVTFTTPPMPISGQLTLAYEINENVAYTQTAKVGNFKISFESPVHTVKTTSNSLTNNQYALELDVPYGYPVYINDGINRYYYNQALGTLLRYVTGPYPTYVACNGWYRYGKAAESFQGLSQLIFQQYINSFKRNLKNIDATLFGMETSNGRFSFAKMLKFDDTDPSQINVSALSYMVGNSTLNLVKSEISGTFLDISDTDITADINTIFDVDSTPPITTNIQIRNNSGDGTIDNVYSIYGSFYTITTGSFPLADGYEIFGIQTGWNVQIDVDIVAGSSIMYVSLYVNTILKEQIIVPANAPLDTYRFNASASYSFTSSDQVYIVYN